MQNWNVFDFFNTVDLFKIFLSRNPEILIHSKFFLGVYTAINPDGVLSYFSSYNDFSWDELWF